MPTIIAVTRAGSEEVTALAEEMRWDVLLAEAGELAWRPPMLDASIRWRMLDDSFGAFSFQGEHAEVAIADAGEVYDLLDDVDVMTEIGNAAAPEDLEAWAGRLGAFAEGEEVLPATQDVLKGLLACDRREFAAAALRGLSRARWPGLADPLRQAGERWPELAADCRRAIASIQLNPAGKAA